MIELSQTMINLYEKYKNGEECGEFINLAYILKVVPEEDMEADSSDAMLMGTRFEYEALGNKDYYGKTPKVFLTKTGGFSSKQTTITIQATNFKEWMNKENNTIISRGERIVHKINDDYSFSVMRDLIFADGNGERVLCDLKMSGNLGNKESEWGWHKDTLLSHSYKVNQALFYTLVDVLEAREKGETIVYPLPFVFYVASSRDADHSEKFKLLISEAALKRAEARFHEIAKEIVFEHTVTGFTARPGSRCGGCAAKNICTKKDEISANGSYTILNV